VSPEELTALVASPDEYAVRDAVRACAERMRGPGEDDRVGLAIVLVRLAETHRSARVREEIAKACDALPDPFFDAALEALDKDPDPYVREHARRAADRRAVQRKAKQKQGEQQREADAVLREIEATYDKGARRLAERAVRRGVEHVTARLYHELAKVQDAVNGSLDRLTGEIESDAPGKAALRRHASELRGRVDYMHAIVKRGREYGAQIKPDFARTEVGALVEEARVQLFSRLVQHAPAHAARVAFQADLEPGLAMDVDRHAMLQAFQNLLQNAVEAYDDDAAARPVRVVARGRRGGSEVVIDVVDEGAGMNDEARRSLFLPFHSGKPGGTGVGLLVVRTMVEEVHEGTLAIESQLGVGTKVTMVIPARRAAAAATPGAKRKGRDR